MPRRGSGTIVATATIEVWLNHTAGYFDTAMVRLDSNVSGGPFCSGPAVFLFAPTNESSIWGAYNRYYLPLDGVFYTYANETATFFFDGGMGKYPTTGPDWAWFAEATLVLVYYPGAVYSTQSAP